MEEFDEVSFFLGEEKFTAILSENLPYQFIAGTPYEKEDKLLQAINVPIPNIGGIQIRIICHDACPHAEYRDILKQIVSSIHLASDSR